MEIIRRGSDYALRSLSFMAQYPQGQVFDIALVAKKRHVSECFLHKIFQRLSKKGILISHRGSKGGYSLKHAPSEISAYQIIESLQGELSLNRCLSRDFSCERQSLCSIHDELKSLQQRILMELKELTIEKIAQKEAKKRSIVT